MGLNADDSGEDVGVEFVAKKLREQLEQQQKRVQELVNPYQKALQKLDLATKIQDMLGQHDVFKTPSKELLEKYSKDIENLREHATKTFEQLHGPLESLEKTVRNIQPPQQQLQALFEHIPNFEEIKAIMQQSVQAPKRQTGSSLKGKFFLSFNNKKELEYHGQIVEDYCDGTFLVQLYSTLTEQENGQEMVDRKRMGREAWRFYDTKEHWQDEYEREASKRACPKAS